MEEYFRFPSPPSDADSILGIERPSSGNRVPDANAPAPLFGQHSDSSGKSLAAAGTLPGADEFSRQNPSGAADFHEDAEARSIGARAPSGGGGALANDNPARRRIRIKVMGKIDRTGEETDERPTKRIKTARCCGVCGKHGHNARTCQEAAESSESLFVM
jgi:hypothetical protein